ncbi:excinuclease ABC subunit UvrC [Nitratifractor sp.]|uniref:excinuclease ABC subunit UvrC n=1 Tax=Nitratifractor sp. TaxID=2268144 RepID=UPI0025E3CC0F|nr:excinuclease ABC subunit UvrC [Nitratifractor sp.]
MTLAETLADLPASPGVYQYFDGEGRLLYVGKAKNLRNRVRSYWRFTPSLRPNPDQSPRILKMLHEARSLEYLVVESEADALILENSLIKQLKPKYNILLRDDKTYPYLYLDEAAPFPRFELTRKVVRGKKVRYYGPFPSGGRALLEALYFLFPLVQKAGCLQGKKACLFHQIGRCPAPCEGKITSEEYRRTVEEAKAAIHNLPLILRRLEKRMMKLAEKERFEEAAKVRDQIEAIRGLEIHSEIDLARQEDYDIFAIDPGSDRGVVVRLFMRGGRITASSYSYFRHTELYDPDEAYRQALLDFYREETPGTASTILLAHDLEQSDEVAGLLSQRSGRRLRILTPRRGPKAQLTRLALSNAAELLRRKEQRPGEEPVEQKVAELFNLERIPWRVEAFDNSHMMGEASVGAMVVWDEGAWEKSSYRRYRLEAKDEYHQMMEMLERRIGDFDKEPPPDLWLIDGGETLRRLAEDLLRQAGVNLPVLAIAKEKLDAKAHRAKGAARDLLHGPAGELRLDPRDARLQWLQRLRDEAHRFAITYHRNQKRRQDRRITLLEQKGIGPATLRKLLDYFSTFDAIMNADASTLSEVAGERAAKTICMLRSDEK